MKNSELFLTGDEDKDTRRVTYLIFISAVAVLSFVVAMAYYIIPDPEVKQVLRILDTFYAIIFFIDFLQRFRHVADRKHYMLRWGWLDLISSIPGIPAFRIVRSLTILRSSHQILAVTPDEIERQARGRIAESVLFVTIFAGLIIISVGSVLIIWVEADVPGAEITTGSDAIWWSLVTVSTVGYGDVVPKTNTGRVIAVLMILIGVALFTTTTSYLASNFTDRDAKKQREQQIDLARKNAGHMEAMLERILALEQKLIDAQAIDDPGEAGEDQNS